MNKARKIVSNNIVYWRLKRKMTQEEFAYQMKSSTQYISQIENGKRNISIDYINRLSEVLKIEMYELWMERETLISRRIDGK